MARSADEARQAIRDLLTLTGMSMRAMSAAMGRDADYVAAFLDPRRRTRARPTPDDLAALAEATGASLPQLLDAVWGVRAPNAHGHQDALSTRLAAELEPLTDAERAKVIDYARFLRSTRRPPAR